ncbi:hypothetical protein LTR36_006999 [Oleoguttula mirabilis]|uniref:Peroxisomal membrane protein PEX14 n=1 Tax=Oleoguttula mirabilis TaxID=1507867 RepID=A0AAV9JAK0_9PEZI|nr:hypothetical protein LTR36_006999 [Oleoguttula mirabilis]
MSYCVCKKPSERITRHLQPQHIDPSFNEMVREDLIEGAVSFLQDPSVAAAPIDQRTAFLRSKNLTQEEIDVSLARVGQSSTPQTSQLPPANFQQQQQYRQPPPQQYASQQAPPYWNQPPPEIPRRDWRDWFIMATVVGGVGYGMYWTARRYISPLISPPTAPQLEQDKASIDQSFDKAFALLDQLATDTADLKASEQARTERLDAALAEVESVIGRMKEANEARELESKRLARELADIREQIPMAIEKEKEGTEARLRDLAGEMKSLKTLVGNRMQQPPLRPAGVAYTPSAPAVNGNAGAPPPTSPAVQAPSPQANGVGGAGAVAVGDGEKLASASALPDRSTSGTPLGRTLAGGRAQIPSWQLAAKKRSEEAKKEDSSGTATPQDVSESGTAQAAEGGAAAQ